MEMKGYLIPILNIYFSLGLQNCEQLIQRLRLSVSRSEQEVSGLEVSNLEVANE